MIKNSQLIDSKTHIFKILDFITIQLFGGFLWQGDDIDNPNVRGSNFWAFTEPPDKAVAGIMIVDISNDIEEVDVNLLNERKLNKFDELLRLSNSEDKEIIEWLGSKLITTEGIQKLETQFIYKQGGSTFQNIEIRFLKAGKKIAVLCKYDLALKDPLARLISKSIQSVKVDSN